ncbi:hypothetical protein AAFF_G00387590 [Aldrovandia affinis]|uniref:Secreted protein n=1 Tax=Aldrovandia affinis TaxID=143900 RepID=A0AAD7SEM5_9TELE|nr:hypothetical protein AAFF_G00387590 [Aldrovandia affinis]
MLNAAAVTAAVLLQILVASGIQEPSHPTFNIASAVSVAKGPSSQVTAQGLVCVPWALALQLGSVLPSACGHRIGRRRAGKEALHARMNHAATAPHMQGGGEVRRTSRQTGERLALVKRGNGAFVFGARVEKRAGGDSMCRVVVGEDGARERER